MQVSGKRAGRLAFLAVVLVCAGAVASSWAGASTAYAGDVSDDIESGNLTLAAGSDDADDGGSTDVAGDAGSDPEDGSDPASGSGPGGNATDGTPEEPADTPEVTVVTTQGFYVSDEQADIFAFGPDRDVVYYNDTYRVYFDIDPVEGERYTFEYVAAEHFNDSTCADVWSDTCTRNVVERVNISTGETSLVYAELTPRVYSARWHDADRVNDTHYAVADILHDRVYFVDLRTGNITWQWNATRAYTEEAGGQSGDWTHINDVELLDDGRVMLSLRNMDEVVFVRPGEGMLGNWTLGEDDDHETLYEQHNPDYIPEERGGPSVVVGDSENNRAVEYHRLDNGTWAKAWAWRDVDLQWPRDADRLPNGNTLVADSHGDRVVEVGTNGEVVWSIDVGMPYDVERLGTGDESAGGPARAVTGDERGTNEATGTTAEPGTTPGTDAGGDGGSTSGESESTAGESAGTAGSTPGPTTVAAGSAPAGPSLVDRFWLGLKTLAPNLVVNGLLYVSPSWVHFTDLVFALVFLLTVVSWGVAEFYWSRYSLRSLARRARVAARGALDRG